MLLKFTIGIVFVLSVFLIYVGTRDGKFSYERSGVINAAPEKIFPYISQFKMASEWSPYEKGIEMPKKYGGTDGTVGAWFEFGPSKSGSGRIEITEIVPNEMVKLNLHMTAPFEGINIVTYKLSKVEGGTKFSWSMSGDGGYFGKLLATVIDCEKMVAGQFDVGIENLKVLMESQKN